MSWSARLQTAIATPETPEQKATREAREALLAQQALANLANALELKATALCTAIEYAWAHTEPGISTGKGKYWQDHQYTIGGLWKGPEILLAKTKWIAIYDALKTKDSLKVHVLGPAQKATAGRGIQANFIRNRPSGQRGRFNMHVNQG